MIFMEGGVSTNIRLSRLGFYLFSLHIRSMWETTMMHKQVSGWTVNFGPNFFGPKPLSGIEDQKDPPPHFGKLQIWDDQSLLRNTPILENFRFGMTKVYAGIPPPILENFTFGMTKVYSGIPPPISENFRFGMTKVYSGIPPPILENFRFGMTKVYSGIPPPFWKTSHLGWPKFTLEYPPPFWKTSDLGWPKFTQEYPPPILENFRFGMTKVYSGIPPHFGKLQIWDDQSLLRNTPPILENFRFGMTKVYSGIPPPFWKTSDLGWPKFTLEYPPPPAPMKIVRESKSEIFRIPRVTTCGDFIQPR